MNPNLFPLADFGSEFGPVIAAIGIMLIPIVAILTAHQRKMAQIIHGSQQNRQIDPNVSAEVNELKQLVYQQSIAIDQLSTKLDKVSAPEIEDRISGTTRSA
jgi:methyl-accepting chemotaxis protein